VKSEREQEVRVEGGAEASVRVGIAKRAERVGNLRWEKKTASLKGDN